MARRPRLPRDAAEARHPRYYARNAHPNFRDFGAAGPPDDTDAEGRQYRLGPFDDATGTRRLFVRLPRPDVPWFDADAASGGGVVVLPALGRTLRIVAADIMPAHRTGHVDVEWRPDDFIA